MAYNIVFTVICLLAAPQMAMISRGKNRNQILEIKRERKKKCFVCSLYNAQTTNLALLHSVKVCAAIKISTLTFN